MSDNLPKLIALTGVMGSGKTTVARYLCAKHGYTRTRFAGPLKAMLSALLLESGADTTLVNDMVDGKLKEQPSDLLQGATPRHAMQTLGTEWGRNMLGPSLWTDAWRRNIEQLIARGGRVVVDDCRFPNEAALVHEMGGKLVQVVNLSLPIAPKDQCKHQSEQFGFGADAVLNNMPDGGLQRLYQKVEKLIEMLAYDA